MEYSNLEPTEYPAIFYPSSVLKILEATPPEPPSPNLVQPPPTPVPPAKITFPTFNKVPPKRVRYGLISFLVAVAIGMIGIAVNQGMDELILFLLITLSAGATIGTLIFQWFSYPKRLNKYRQDETEHKRYIARLKKDFANRQKFYRKELDNYQHKYQLHEAQNQQILNEYYHRLDNLERPEVIQQWRKSQLASISFYPCDLGNEVDINNFKPRGFSEYEKNSELPRLLRYYFGSKIHVLRYVRGYIPDFAYVDDSCSLSIDIEIDEPYTPRQYPNSNQQLKITHCLGQDRYDSRTKEFQSNDWFVLYFSERQALFYPSECCKTVAQLIDNITGSQLVETKFKNVQDLKPEPRWTESQARQMAERRERLNYKRTNI